MLFLIIKAEKASLIRRNIDGEIKEDLQTLHNLYFRVRPMNSFQEGAKNLATR